jgi:hypothetical protein
VFVGDDDTDIAAELCDGESDGGNDTAAEDDTEGRVTKDVVCGDGENDTVIISALSEDVTTKNDDGGSVAVDTAGSAVVTIKSIAVGCCVELNIGTGVSDTDGCLIGETVIGALHSPALHAVTPDQQCSPEGHL